MKLKTACESQYGPITFFKKFCTFNFVRVFDAKNIFLFTICDTDFSSYVYHVPRWKSSYADSNTASKNRYIYNLPKLRNFFRTYFKNDLKLQYCYFG